MLFVIDAAEILEPFGIETNHFREGGNVTLTCVGVGHPPPLVQWSKLNGSLSNRVSSSNMSLSTNEGNVTRVTIALMITNVFREDTGVYECSVSNHLNTVTGSINLIVQCMYVHAFEYYCFIIIVCMMSLCSIKILAIDL